MTSSLHSRNKDQLGNSVQSEQLAKRNSIIFICHQVTSLTLPVIPHAEPPPPFLWLLSLLSHHHNWLSSHISRSRMFFIMLEYTSYKLSEWDWYDLLFREYCQSYSPRFSRHMKYTFQSREWDLPLLVDDIAASHYQHPTLEGKKDCMTLHI